MNLYLETVPLNSAHLAKWLERHLVGDHLGELIEELLALRTPPSALDFTAWFAPVKEQVLSGGLSGVPKAALRQLLSDPRALRQLQKVVLLGGGRYWDQVPRSKGFLRRLAATRPSPPPTPPTARTRTPLPKQNHKRSHPSEPIPLTVAPPEEPPAPTPARRGSVPLWAVLLAVIATVAVTGVVVWLVLARTMAAE